MPARGPSTLTLESRCLRLGGLAFIFAAIAAMAVLDDAADVRALLGADDRWPFARAAIAFVGAANLFAVGLVLLLAGMQELSLLTSGAARRGALARLAGVNLMLLCFAFVAIQDAGVLDDAFYESWYALPILALFVVVAHTSIRLFRTGWKHEARSADDVMRSDPRPPVVYLRSFAIDDQVLVTTGGAGSRVAAMLTYTASVSPEQEMAFILDRIGPVIAIGKPGERLPELGAARLYVGNDEWQQVVGSWIDSAALVVLRAGETEGLWWEVTQAIKRCPPRRVVIVMLGAAGSLPGFERRFTETFGAPLAGPRAPQSRAWTAFLRLFVPYGRSAGRIIHFDEQARPHEVPLEYRLTWTGVVLSPYRPYRDSLTAAFKTVFARLDIPWSMRRSATAAVLLAFFGGIFGLHHFYMGHSRRGFWTLAFFWTAVPMLLGWIDAVRLALLDEPAFRARLSVPPAPVRS